MKILYLTWDDVTRPTCGCALRSAFLYGALKKVGEVDCVRLQHDWERETLVAKIFRKLTKVARWPFGKPCRVEVESRSRRADGSRSDFGKGPCRGGEGEKRGSCKTSVSVWEGRALSRTGRSPSLPRFCNCHTRGDESGARGDRALLRTGNSTVNLNHDLQPQPQNYDAVVCRYLSTAAITQAWRIAPCYVDIDDLPSEAFASVESKRLPPILRPLGAFLVRHWQRYCLRKCSGAWVVSESDKSAISHFSFLTSHFPISTLPNLARRPGPDYRVDAPQERLLMTVGLMGYDPNREGVEWFLTTIWPKVHERWPDLTYAIAGGGLPEDVKARWMQIPCVQVLGFVDDLDALYAKSLAVVTPILSGAGTCIKVAEAGLHGRIVFATPKATRGHEALTALGGIKVFESADQFCAEFEAVERDRVRADFQNRLSVETRRINSEEEFEQRVRNVLEGSV